MKVRKVKKFDWGGAWLAQPEEHEILDLEVIN